MLRTWLPGVNSLESTRRSFIKLRFVYERTVFRWAAEQLRDSVAEHTWQEFWLTRVEGISVEEAASRLQIRPGNIYFARSRVMARIKELVKQYEAKE